MILFQNSARKQFFGAFIGLFLVSFGLLWRFHASQKAASNDTLNVTNVLMDDEPLIANPFGKISIAKDENVVNEIKAKVRNLREDKNLGHLWQGLLELRVGNHSLKSMKDGLLSVTGSCKNFT